MIILDCVENEFFYDIVIMVKEIENCVKEDVDKKVKEIFLFVI